MPSYLRLLTEKASNITTPPTGHTAVWASSGETGYDQYDLYLKNPEGFIYRLGGTGSTISSNKAFYSGLTVYSGGYTSSGSPEVAMVIDGILSGLNSNGVYINPGLNVSGATSGTTNLTYGTANTMNGVFSQAFGTGNTVSQTGSTAFGTGNTASAPTAFAIGGGNTSSGEYGFAGGSANTASGLLSFSIGTGNTSSGIGSVTLGGDNIASHQNTFAGGTASTASGLGSFAYGSGNTSSGVLSTSFGSGNTASGVDSFVIGDTNTASGLYSFAAGSGTTASGTSEFSIGHYNAFSSLFSIGNSTGGTPDNVFTVTQSGVTIQSSGTNTNNISRYSGSPAAALTVFSGSGSHPLGFQLPLVEEPYGESGGGSAPRWPDLSGSSADGKGMIVWDGSSIRVWTGGTLWATVGLLGDGGAH
jgi:hypothetical protein